MSDAVDKLREAAARNVEVNDHVTEVAEEHASQQEREATQQQQEVRENGNAGS